MNSGRPEQEFQRKVPELTYRKWLIIRFLYIENHN